MAYSADSRRLATGGEDGSVRLWEPNSGELLRILLGHGQKVTCLAWSPDGKVLASGSPDHTVRLWEPDSGKVLQTLTRHTGPIVSLAWSPDGKALASASGDRSVRLWDPASGESSRSIDIGMTGVAAVAWLSGQRIITTSISGRESRTIRLWDADTGKTVHSHEAKSLLVWTADCNLMAYKSGDKEVTFWETESNRSRQLTLKEHDGAIGPLALSFDGKLLATGNDKTQIQMYDAASGQRLSLTGPHVHGLFHLAFSPNGKTLASSQSYGPTFLWRTDAEKGEPAKPVQTIGNVSSYQSAGWSPDSQTIFVAGANGSTARFYDAPSGKERYTLPVVNGGEEADWSPDGMFLAIGIHNPGKVGIWEVGSAKWLRSIGEGGPVAWAPDGKRIASRGTLWTAESGARSLNLAGHNPFCVVWSPDSKKLATYGNHQHAKVELWDAGTAKGIVLSASAISAHALAWSPDGQVLATGGYTLTLWHTSTGKELAAKFEGHEALVYAVAWSPDGLTLASGTGTGTIRLWNAKTGQLQKTFQGHDGPVHALAWLADSKTLASLGEKDGTVRFSQTDTDKAPRTIKGLPGVGHFSPDRKLLVSRYDPTRVQVWETETGRLRGTLLYIPGQPEQYLAISPNGHYRITGEPWRHIVYVLQTERGQEILSPEAFETKYKWKNDPEKVRLTEP